MAETRSYHQVELAKEGKYPSAEIHLMQRDNPGKRPITGKKDDRFFHGSGGIGQVIIPEDLTMATNIRSYREWPGEDGLPQSPAKSLRTNFATVR